MVCISSIFRSNVEIKANGLYFDQMEQKLQSNFPKNFEMSTTKHKTHGKVPSNDVVVVKDKSEDDESEELDYEFVTCEEDKATTHDSEISTGKIKWRDLKVKEFPKLMPKKFTSKYFEVIDKGVHSTADYEQPERYVFARDQELGFVFPTRKQVQAMAHAWDCQGKWNRNPVHVGHIPPSLFLLALNNAYSQMLDLWIPTDMSFGAFSESIAKHILLKKELPEFFCGHHYIELEKINETEMVDSARWEWLAGIHECAYADVVTVCEKALWKWKQ